MKSFLFIDTSDPEAIEVGLREGEQVGWARKKARAQEVLKLIDAVLKGRSFDFVPLRGTPLRMTQWLGGIAVKTGRGTFTGIRIGAAVANAIGFVLGAPVVATEGDLRDRKVQDQLIAKLRKGATRRFVAPTYSEPPRVTMKL